MNDSSANPFDLTITRIIHAPRQRVWGAWADPSTFEKWWIPAPLTCKAREMELRPGGSFRTEMSEDGVSFEPHITGCFLAVEELERIVFTDALVAGWRPADSPFVTASFTFADHAQGTLYTSTAMHRNRADRDKHEQLGFHDGWGTVINQLAKLVETR
ncbi:SRPBCC family protein [Arthrobacter sp.]|uniref:SRPBCC family protein n=1 Tax=Arthrobacter sp. TaxID=1667 RepID=UPI003A8DC578